MNPLQIEARRAAKEGPLFQYENTDDPIWKYRIVKNYNHICRYPLTVHPDGPDVISEPYWGADDECVGLYIDYTWNGSNVVADVRTDMLASAIHDAQCQAMRMGFYKGTLRNWRRAAKEYRHNCRIAGMPRARAWVRYIGLVVGGGNGYKWRWIVRHAT